MLCLLDPSSFLIFVLTSAISPVQGWFGSSIICYQVFAKVNVITMDFDQIDLPWSRPVALRDFEWRVKRHLDSYIICKFKKCPILLPYSRSVGIKNTAI